MKTKTCGECVFFSNSENKCCLLEGPGIRYANNDACKKFKPEPPKPKLTNGDVIRQGGNRALAEFHGKLACDVCAYRYDHRCIAPQGKPLTCADGIEAWLNAPADCVKHTESEGKDE